MAPVWMITQAIRNGVKGLFIKVDSPRLLRRIHGSPLLRVAGLMTLITTRGTKGRVPRKPPTHPSLLAVTTPESSMSGWPMARPAQSAQISIGLSGVAWEREWGVRSPVNSDGSGLMLVADADRGDSVFRGGRPMLTEDRLSCVRQHKLPKSLAGASVICPSHHDPYLLQCGI